MKRTLLSFLTTTLFLICPFTQAAELTAEEEMFIKLAINDLVNEYAVKRDSGDAVGYANTFSEDGYLDLYGTKYNRAQLIERVESANPNAVGMHHMASGHVSVTDAENATGVQYFTLYTGTKGEDHEEGSAVNISSFLVMGKYHDTYVLTEEGWKFAERRVESVFRPE